MTDDKVTPNEIEEIAPIEIIDKTPPKPKENPTSSDTSSPYDEMDITDEDIQTYMEDINAQ